MTVPFVPDGAALEALAQRVADLVADRIAAGPPLVTAEVVAEHLGVERSYVYENAVKLGARRLGDGPKARLRFSLSDVDRLLTCSSSRGSEMATSTISKGVRKRGAVARLGTNVDLLPIRGSSVPGIGSADRRISGAA